MKKPFRIPTILGILLVLLLVGGIAILTQYVFRIPSEADVGSVPQDVVFSNTSDNGFTVTWKTDKPTRGIVQVQEDIPNASRLPYFDERHIPGNIGTYTMHSVPVRGLKANTAYRIFILEKETSTIRKDQSYTTSTGPALELTSNTLSPTYGNVVTAAGEPAVGSLVYLTLPGSQTLSTLVKQSGSFLIPLNLVRTENASSYLHPDSNNPVITITIHTDTVVTHVVTDTINSSPVPEVVVGKTYDFRGKSQQGQKKQQETLADNTSATASVLGTQSATFRVGITSPAKGSHITSPYPYFSGTGIPNMFVTLTIGMKDPLVTSTKVSGDGTWAFTPKKPLGIGNQSVTMTTVDANKKPVAITHLFEIMKSGTQVLGSATPSGTIAPTLMPSVFPTIQPTIAIQPTEIITPTTTPPITGIQLPTTLFFIVGLVLTAGGIFALAF